VFLTWCTGQGLDPLRVRRHQFELYVRWLQEVRRFKPSTVSRRTSVVAGFYRAFVIDGVLTRSPADYLRRPTVPAESPTLGLTHLQFEALLFTARQSADRHDFALVAMLGLLGLRIFEATAADIADLGEEHGHRVLRVVGKGTKVVLVPLPPGVGRAIDQAVAGRTSGPILRNSRGRRMDRHTATRRLQRLAASASFAMPHLHPHMLGHTYVTTMLDAGVDLRDVQPPATPTRGPRCATTGPARTSTVTRTTSSPRTWPQAPDHRGAAPRSHADERTIEPRGGLQSSMWPSR
jgi:site-specific recombinase XerD